MIAGKASSWSSRAREQPFLHAPFLLARRMTEGRECLLLSLPFPSVSSTTGGLWPKSKLDQMYDTAFDLVPNGRKQLEHKGKLGSKRIKATNLQMGPEISQNYNLSPGYQSPWTRWWLWRVDFKTLHSTEALPPFPTSALAKLHPQIFT